MYQITSAAVPMAGEADALPILPYLPELILGTIIFGVFYWLVAKYVVPSLEKVYAERAALIEGGIKKAEIAQAEAAAAKEQYEAQLQEARAESTKIRDEAREQGAVIIAEMRAQAQAEAARITESAQKQIAAERQQASVSLRSEVGRISTDLASKIVGESLHDEARQNGIIDRFLAELESGNVVPEKLGAGVDGAGPGSGDDA